MLHLSLIEFISLINNIMSYNLSSKQNKTKTIFYNYALVFV